MILALAIPAVFGSLLILGSRRIRAVIAGWMALAVSVATLAATVTTVGARSGRIEITDRRIDEWAVGARFATDTISSPLALLTAGITLLVVVHGMRHRPRGGSAGLFFGLLLLVEFGALATFWTRDVIGFFIAFEIVLIPMWVLIHRFGDDHDRAARRAAALRFVLYTAFGSSVMLVGILALVAHAGTSDMRLILGAGVPRDVQLWIAGLLVLGLAVKVPLVPFHSWLPPAHTIAPTAGSVLLAAVLLKMGTYGLIRLPLALTPNGFARLGPGLAILGVVGILWGGLICLVERDLKRLIAYSSVAHMGFIALALGTGSALGLQAALIANVAHGVISALLFFVVGGLKERWGSVDLSVVRPALRESWPGLGVALMVGLAGSLGLPGLAGFWGEFLAITAAWNPTSGGPAAALVWLQGSEQIGWFAYSPLEAQYHVDGVQIWLDAFTPDLMVMRGLAIAAALGAVLAAAYSLRVAKLIWMGNEAPRDRSGDLSPVEAIVTGVLVIAIIVIGLAPYLVFSGASLVGGMVP
ncbi:complex I subunit 4 family protein [Nostocoides jenkinsii]|uniref:Putative NADH dehydrogenase I chain M n=1 Tax=Nostocoides jenkinsii Ben 74 TaxID=1193518 RepID=A0A077MFN8_9MICO|nr:NADH-quinone oxidoreductase subunit M [Tetrasphaera jenkinsii]CCI54920.1 putative NADH dehydrogenase I chain M [Tetrasphaera jenkinsii Ben 74]